MAEQLEAYVFLNQDVRKTSNCADIVENYQTAVERDGAYRILADKQILVVTVVTCSFLANTIKIYQILVESFETYRILANTVKLYRKSIETVELTNFFLRNGRNIPCLVWTVKTNQI